MTWSQTADKFARLKEQSSQLPHGRNARYVSGCRCDLCRRALEATIHDLEVAHGVPPTVGAGGLRKLVDDGYAMAAPWCKLLAAETRETVSAVYVEEPAQGSLFGEVRA
jgi:hypothetical protein